MARVIQKKKTILVGSKSINNQLGKSSFLFKDYSDKSSPSTNDFSLDFSKEKNSGYYSIYF